jgi:hypothetical protein
MRIVLDECVPRPLRRELSGHSVTTILTNLAPGDVVSVAAASRRN